MYVWSFTSNVDRDDARWDDLRLILHPFIWRGEWQGFWPVGLLVQCCRNVGNGTLRSMSQSHRLPISICISSNLSRNNFQRVIWNDLVKLKAHTFMVLNWQEANFLHIKVTYFLHQGSSSNHGDKKEKTEGNGDKRKTKIAGMESCQENIQSQEFGP